ncbi:acyl-CoA thioesterase [Roseicyclus mahoneyensis]|jgi:acyl-CoA thioester hydrolase|uniref:(3S)-malyl-CoA thioesterase n=1 Tax=Roseicyclus mahoneyensis TaxID=164332 RepID=A0A316GN31_9RHOB|nr:thioesterase family protein [Roseicyclus mahoneyensis]PWK60843.1 (3S)-malyl-CoA thioesterase [Roseicyclus mahoneyensis]
MQTLRRPVAPRDCDILGHMNVAAYVDAVSDAMFTLQGLAGLDRAAIAATHRSFVAARLECDYRAEMLTGDVLSMESRVLSVGTKSARFAHRMTRLSDGALVFEAENISVYFDLQARRALPIPDDLRQALARLRDAT